MPVGNDSKQYARDSQKSRICQEFNEERGVEKGNDCDQTHQFTAADMQRQVLVPFQLSLIPIRWSSRSLRINHEF